MKKTLLFSNLIGNILLKNSVKECRFNDYTARYLKDNIQPNSNLVFINAPGFSNEENYLRTIINCFNKIDIFFDSIVNFDNNSFSDNRRSLPKGKVVYFLMGGNPLTQFDIISYNNLKERIRNHNGLVIGFCAGAINLSKYSIITSDDDFDKATSYLGINRVSLCIEPHYNSNTCNKREKELMAFSQKYNTEILAIPDESIIIVEEETVIERGKIYHIKD